MLEVNTPFMQILRGKKPIVHQYGRFVSQCFAENQR